MLRSGIQVSRTDADSGGYPDPDHYLGEFGQRIGYPLTREEWVKARRERDDAWPEMLHLAKRIGKQARTAIYTNNGPLTKATLRQALSGSRRAFSRTIFFL